MFQLFNTTLSFLFTNLYNKFCTILNITNANQLPSKVAPLALWIYWIQVRQVQSFNKEKMENENLKGVHTSNQVIKK